MALDLKHLFVVDEDRPRLSTGAVLLNVIIVGFGVFALFRFGFASLDYRFHWENVWQYRVNLANGFLMTIVLSFFSLILSVVLGAFFGLSQGSRIVPLKYLARIYIEGIRGTPLLVQILIFFYVIANALGVNDRYVVGVIIMSLFAGAYIAEIIRAGVESIGESQLESARAIGLTHMQTYRYVIFPQVVSRVLPPLAGQFASLIKDSSLLSIIAIKEFTMAAREVNANTFSTMESYIPLAIGYLALTLPISWLTKRLERKFAYAT